MATPDDIEADDIKTRAYLKWLDEGMPDGRAEQHWLEAEREAAAASEGRQFALTGDPIQTPEEQSRQEKPEVTEYRKVLGSTNVPGPEKAPPSFKVFAPNQD